MVRPAARTRTGMPLTLHRTLGAVRRLGARGLLFRLVATPARALWRHEQLIVFQVRPEELNPVTPKLRGEPWRFASAPARGFRWPGRTPMPAPVADELKTAVEGQRVHWIEVGGEVVSCGFSAPAPDGWPLTETHSHLRVPAGGVCLTTFETAAAWRGRGLYPAVLTGILSQRFGEQVPVAFIWCRPQNVASDRAIRRVGFREIARHDYWRILGMVRRRETRLP